MCHVDRDRRIQISYKKGVAFPYVYTSDSSKTALFKYAAFCTSGEVRIESFSWVALILGARVITFLIELPLFQTLHMMHTVLQRALKNWFYH